MKTNRITKTALLTGIALIIHVLEAQLPPIVPVPGVKLGLANVVTLLSLYMLSPRETVLVVACRLLLGSFFSGGWSQLMYAAAGSFLSLCVMIPLCRITPPKYMFLLSKNVASVINFGLTLVIFFIFVAVDGIAFHFRFLMIIYPIVCLIVFNIGCGFILSALFVIFKDVQYLYDIFTLMLMYLSAIFYYTDTYSENVRRIFYLNPLYVYITYIRHLIIDGYIPGLATHGLCLFYAVAVLAIGALIYKKYNYKFMYYM